MNPDELRAGLHAMWGSVAGGWRQHADFVDARSRPVTERMVAVTAPRPGERVIELGCGPGTVGIAMAPLVADEGEVVLSDVAPEMVAVASERAASRGLRNVRGRELDLEAIDEPDASFDIAVCREALMLVVEPARAAGEIRRVLRPGGRAAIAVWGPRERNPWLGLVLDAVTAQVGVEVPPPGVPGPFSLDDPARFEQALSGAGFDELRLEEVEVPLHASTSEEWWTRTLAMGGPVGALVAGLPEDKQAALRDRLEQAARPYATGEGLEFPGVVLLATARR